ncbi:MAG TPA: RNA-binding domain-containing protein [Candidatus Dormibacteraeota bacterium]|nr:RNA-binding domain-containing protein [Candidatus Dormibacteraeota bacterium]
METTVTDLFQVLGMTENVPLLEKAWGVQRRLKDLGLRLVPDLDVGTLDSSRCLDFIARPVVGQEHALQEISRGESERVEMKSSLLYDYQKASHNPQASMNELRSDLVLHASLKTVAAFLTTNGGVLYVGVGPLGDVIGLDVDFACVNSKMPNQDGWELTFRDFVKSRFKDGETVAQYIDLSFIEISGKTIAHIQVSPRSRLSFLKGTGGQEWVLYKRDGNRSLEVKIDQVEEFLEIRRRDQ